MVLPNPISSRDLRTSRGRTRPDSRRDRGSSGGSGLISQSQLRDLKAARIVREYVEPEPFIETDLDITETPQYSEQTLRDLSVADAERRRREEEAEQQRQRNFLSPIFDALAWYDDNVSAPIASIGLGLIGSVTPLGKQYREAWNQAKESGQVSNIWEQLRYAYRNTDTPFGLKFGLEVVTDPLNFVPYGLATKAIRGGLKGGKLLAKGEGGKIGRGIADTAGTVRDQFTQSSKNLAERVYSKAKGLGYTTQAERSSRVRRNTSAYTKKESRNGRTPTDELAAQSMPGIGGWRAWLSPLMDPDNITLAFATRKLGKLTDPQGPGIARGASGAIDPEQAPERLAKLEEQLSNLQLGDQASDAAVALESEIEKLQEVIEYYDEVKKHMRRNSWFYDSFWGSRVSPLYWLFKGFRGVGHHVFMMKSLPQKDPFIYRSVLAKKETQAKELGTMAGIRHSETTVVDEATGAESYIKMVVRPGGFRHRLDMLGRRFKLFGMTFRGGDGYQTGNNAVEQLRTLFRASLKTRGVDYDKVIDLVDDFQTTGSTIMEMARIAGVPEAEAVVLFNRLSKPEMQAYYHQVAQESARYTSLDNLAESAKFILENPNVSRADSLDDAGQKLKDMLGREPDMIIDTGTVRINIRYLGDPKNPAGIYGKDDIFGINLEWHPLLGKRIDGLDRFYGNELTDLDEYGRLVGADSFKEEGVFEVLENDTVANLATKPDIRTLQRRYHSLTALEARWHAVWSRKQGRVNVEGEHIERMAPDNIHDLLTDLQKRELDRLFTTERNLIEDAIEHGLPSRIYDMYGGYHYRGVFAGPADAAVATDETMLEAVRRGHLPAESPDFVFNRVGELMQNLDNGVRYLDPDEGIQALAEGLASLEAWEAYRGAVGRTAIMDLGTRVAVLMRHRVAVVTMHHIVSSFIEDLGDVTKRIAYLQNEQLIDQKKFQMRRLAEDIGKRGDELSPNDIKALDKLVIDYERIMNHAWDAVLYPRDTTRRLRHTAEHGLSGDSRRVKTDDQLSSLRRTLNGRVKPGQKFQPVWVRPGPRERYVKTTLRSRDDVEVFMTQLSKLDAEQRQDVWLTNPAKARTTRQRGRYAVDDVPLRVKNRPPGVFGNDLGLAQMHIVMEWMQNAGNRLLQDIDVTPDTIRQELYSRIYRGFTDDATELGNLMARNVEEFLRDASGINVSQELLDDIRTMRAGMGQSKLFDEPLRGTGMQPIIDHIELVLKNNTSNFEKGKLLSKYFNRLKKDHARVTIARAESMDQLLRTFESDIVAMSRNAIDLTKRNLDQAQRDFNAPHRRKVRPVGSDEATYSRTPGSGQRRRTRQFAREQAQAQSDDPDAPQPLGGDDLPGSDEFGSEVTGTYYQRRGTRNPTADVRDAIFTTEGALDGNMPQGMKEASLWHYKFDGDRVPFLAANGYLLTEEGIKDWSKVAADPKSKLVQALRLVEGPNNAMRLFNVGFDWGSFMLQGITTLAVRPDIFAATMMRSIPAYFDEGVISRYILHNWDDFAEMVKHNVILASSRFEAFRLLGPSNSMQSTPYTSLGSAADATNPMDNSLRMQLLGGPMGRRQMGYGRSAGGGTTPEAHLGSALLGTAEYVFKDQATRFERVYNGSVMARHMLWSSMKDTWLRHGGNLDELGDLLNHMTGFVDMGGRGITQHQQAFERNVLFFSTHYTRSALMLVGDALKGGITGAAAQATLAATLAAGMFYHWALATAIGQEPNLDPRPYNQGGDGGQFLTVEIGGHNVGIGTIWVQIARLIGSIGSKDWTDPSIYLKTDVIENDLLRFFRNRVPPTSDGIDQIIRALRSEPMYLGKRLTGFGGHFNQVLSNFVPFSVDTALLQNGPSVGSWIAGASEFAGLREFPMSIYERLRIARDESANIEFGKKWLELDKRQQDWLSNHPQHQRMNELRFQIAIDRRLRTVVADGDLSLLTDVYFEMLEAPLKLWQSDVSHLQEMLDTGQIDTVGFRILLGHANREFRARRDSTNDPLFDEVRAALDEAFQRGVDLGTVQPQDIAWQEYFFQVVGAVDQGDETEYDWALRQQEERDFRRKWGDDTFTYVQQRFRGSRESPDWRYPDILLEYYGGLENYASWYWNDLPNAVFANMPNSTEAMQLWQIYQSAPRTEKKILLDSNHAMREVKELVDAVRRKKREENRDLDIYLYRWGYTNSLVHPDNQAPAALVDFRYGVMTGPPYPLARSTEIR